jgi:hypothetical protein
MENSQPPSPRQRLQALLAIPERDRTDTEWDEINELEIMLAPGNREGAPVPTQNVRRDVSAPMGHHRPNGGGANGQNNKNGKNKRSGKKFHKRPPRGNAP